MFLGGPVVSQQFVGFSTCRCVGGEERSFTIQLMGQECDPYVFGPFGIFVVGDCSGGENLFEGYFVEAAVLADIEACQVEAEALYLPFYRKEEVLSDAISADSEEALPEYAQVGQEVGW